MRHESSASRLQPGRGRMLVPRMCGPLRRRWTRDKAGGTRTATCAVGMQPGARGAARCVITALISHDADGAHQTAGSF